MMSIVAQLQAESSGWAHAATPKMSTHSRFKICSCERSSPMQPDNNKSSDSIFNYEPKKKRNKNKLSPLETNKTP